MLKSIKNKKFIITIIIVVTIISLGTIGSSWKVGFAETNPTLPVIYSISPETICVGSGNTEITIRGDDFIDKDYTWVRWLDITGEYSFIVPDYVSPEKNELRFTVLADKLDEVWDARLWVVNHPPALDEIVGYFIIEIVGCEFIYLPLIMK